jgi:hypothetical protein
MEEEEKERTDLSIREKRLRSLDNGSVAEGASRQSRAIAHKIWGDTGRKGDEGEGEGEEEGRGMTTKEVQFSKFKPFGSRERRQLDRSV